LSLDQVLATKKFLEEHPEPKPSFIGAHKTSNKKVNGAVSSGGRHPALLYLFARGDWGEG